MTFCSRSRSSGILKSPSSRSKCSTTDTHGPRTSVTFHEGNVLDSQSSTSQHVRNYLKYVITYLLATVFPYCSYSSLINTPVGINIDILVPRQDYSF